jgi:hemolysin activation/secretion protein
MMRKSMFKTHTLATACMALFAANVAFAQTTNKSSAADVQRNVEKNLPSPAAPAPKPTVKTVPPTTGEQGFARLKEVQVNSAMYQLELADFWLGDMNQPVPPSRLAEFKAWAWDLFQSKGYLAYLTTQAQATAEGTVLTITVAMPSVGKVTVVTAEGTATSPYAEEVAKRFRAVYPIGALVDVAGFEAQLNAASYDLPVELDVSLRQVNEKVVDVVINLRPLEVTTGKFLSGVTQLNNYGLPAYGRWQVLGNLRFAGLTPQSELALTTQQSEGVQYYRAEYDAPWVNTGMHWKVYASDVRNQASGGIKGISTEAGLGLSKLIATDRTGKWLAGLEASQRQTQNWVAGGLNADRVDQQLRAKLHAESANGWVGNFSNDVVLISGVMDLNRLAEDKTTDATSLNVHGEYQKLEISGGLSQALGKSKLLTGSVRWKAQVASKNLDTYNRMSLGGVTGIRALSSVDGVGDQGAQLSFDLVHQTTPDLYTGLFYDVGTVKNNRVALSTGDTDWYTLQGAGFLLGGKVSKVIWSLSVGASFGNTPSIWVPSNTPIGEARANFAATYPF